MTVHEILDKLLRSFLMFLLGSMELVQKSVFYCHYIFFRTLFVGIKLSDNNFIKSIREECLLKLDLLAIKTERIPLLNRIQQHYQ